MLYLLDANVLIDASRYYYPIQRVPEFWSWLVHVEGRAEVKIPIEIYEEIKDGDDDLGIWSRDDLTGAALLLTDESDPNLVARVTDQGYADNLTDDEVEKIGRDSFLIAYALTAPEEIRVGFLRRCLNLQNCGLIGTCLMSAETSMLNASTPLNSSDG